MSRRQTIYSQYGLSNSPSSPGNSPGLYDDDTLDNIPRVLIRRRNSSMSPNLRIKPAESQLRYNALTPLKRRPKDAAAAASRVHKVLQRRSVSDSMVLAVHPPNVHPPNVAHLEYLPSPNITGDTKKQMSIGSFVIEYGPAIGQGGFSSVYTVTDSVSKKKYALKVVNVPKNGQEEIKANLLKEVKILESLVNVDYVIQLLAYKVEPLSDHIYILMELGIGDLRQILTVCKDATKPLDIDAIRYWGGQILKAVAEIHSRNIVHSDLKPANFIIVNGSLKLCDFGIANPVPEHTCSIHRKSAIGTLLYMAPETLRLAEHDYKVTKASDIWGCGIILYEMVYQTYPFNDRSYLYKAENSELEEIEHFTTSSTNAPVPLVLHEVIRNCLYLDPKQRISAEAAARSAFFSPVSVDLKAVLSMTRGSVKYGYQLGAQNQKISTRDLEEISSSVYKKLVRFNYGNNP